MMCVKPVLLALSTFRQSAVLVERTIDLARREGRPLSVLFVVDENIARYLLGTDVVSAEHLDAASTREHDLLEEHRRRAEAAVDLIKRQAAEAGVAVSSRIVVGRFGHEVVARVGEVGPEKLTLTRSRRPRWVLQLFGSPVDYVIEHADCPVIEDYGVSEEERRDELLPRNWLSRLLSFRLTPGGLRPGVVCLAVVFFLLMALTPAPRSMVAMMSERSPVGYGLQPGAATITGSINRVLGADLTPAQAAYKAKIMIAILFAAALLWATEAIPMGATDLLVGALLYLFYVLPLDAISKAYMTDAVFFIFGVLTIAVGVANTGLDRRIGVLLLGRVRGLKSFCFVFLPLLALAAGFLSEHALIAILVPVLLRIYREVCDGHGIRADRKLAVLLLLGICFAANQGGPGSPAAGGRNAVMVGYLKDYGVPISFAQWMYYALPFVVVVSIAVGGYMYFALSRRIKCPSVDFGAHIRAEVARLPRWTRREAAMAGILVMVILTWVLGSKRFGLGGPCMFAVVLMLPAGILSWKDIQSRVRFEVVGLYAAACAMGVGLKMTGASLWMARWAIGLLPGELARGNMLVVATSVFTGCLTNFMSDGATVAAMGPVVLSLASVAHIHLWRLGLACAFSSSFANVLIIGTPNNAIAYAAGTDPRTGERLLSLRDFLVHGAPVTVIAWLVLWGWTVMGYWRWMSWP